MEKANNNDNMDMDLVWRILERKEVMVNEYFRERVSTACDGCIFLVNHDCEVPGGICSVREIGGIPGFTVWNLLERLGVIAEKVEKGEAMKQCYREKLDINVTNTRKSKTGTLEICYIANTIELYIDGEFLCRGDWIDAFKRLFERALELWPSKEEYEKDTQD